MEKVTGMFTQGVSCEHTGGNCWLDIIHLKDGTVLGISDDCVCLYGSEEEMWEGEMALETFDRPEVIE